MRALFIGQSYIDVTILADAIPTGDEKAVARDYAVSFGGNAVTAAFCCAKLGVDVDLIASLAPDWLGRMFADMASSYALRLHPRPVKRSSLSFVIPKDGKRAILRARDDAYLAPCPDVPLDGIDLLHLDGHQTDAALDYAKRARGRGVVTSLDGGTLRAGTDELLNHIDVAVVAELLCEQMGLTPEAMVADLVARGARVGAVTLGERGLVWREAGGETRVMPALPVPKAEIVDTSGAGDVFHGAYVHSMLATPKAGFEWHFRRARAASAHAIGRLGNEAKLPSLADIERTMIRYDG